MRLTLCVVTAVTIAAAGPCSFAGVQVTAQSAALQRIDLAERLSAGAMRAVNREIQPIAEVAGAVHLGAQPGPGVAWIEGTNFSEGTIELDIRGRDVFQQSFVGVAFHRRDDATYDAVYLRPFNFRAGDPVRHGHAVQYVAVPDHDWPRLRKEFPEEFENPVDASVSPTGWIPVRIVVKGGKIEVFVGAVTAPALAVRKLAPHPGGMIGLWVGNGSDGSFANLRVMRPLRGATWLPLARLCRVVAERADGWARRL